MSSFVKKPPDTVQRDGLVRCYQPSQFDLFLEELLTGTFINAKMEEGPSTRSCFHGDTMGRTEAEPFSLFPSLLNDERAQ
jgi:hypothetical protein